MTNITRTQCDKLLETWMDNPAGAVGELYHIATTLLSHQESSDRTTPPEADRQGDNYVSPQPKSKPVEIEITHIERRIPRYGLPDDQSSGWTSKELLVLNDLIDHAKDFAAECSLEGTTAMAGCWKTTADSLTELRDRRGR